MMRIYIRYSAHYTHGSTQVQLSAHSNTCCGYPATDVTGQNSARACLTLNVTIGFAVIQTQ